jgi:uncharacterized protein (DUF2252 family)
LDIRMAKNADTVFQFLKGTYLFYQSLHVLNCM